MREFAEVINRNSLEGESNTPDFVLAKYLFDCLIAYNQALVTREVKSPTP